MTQVPPPPQPMLSPDGRWRWDGSQWVANEPAPPPQAYPSPPPVSRPADAASTSQAAAPGWAPPPMAPTQGVPMAPMTQAPPPRPAPGAMPPPPGAAWGPPPAATRGLAYQFSGNALWSIILGLVSVVVPLFTSFYFPILPLFGLWRGVLAIQRGRVAGGVIGLVLNVLGGLVSLLASGLLFR